MKRLFILSLGLLLCASLTAQGALQLADDQNKPQSVAPGKEFAHAISTITGVAISPLLGASAYGCVMYWRAPEENRASLPWFAQPQFWIPALLLCGFVALKDVLGTAAPTALKKPFDIAEAIENKISGLVAAGLFVPLIATIFEDPNKKTALLSSMGFAAADLSWLYNALTIPVAIAAFILVWLVGNAINVLIVLSPFTTVDAALKLARLALLASVPATAYINPWLGAAWALLIIVVSWFLAGWSLRLTHFGSVIVWDYLTRRCKRFSPDEAENKMFLARAIKRVPTRTYGRLSRSADGKLIFKYRPWFILPQRTLELPEGKYEAGAGVFYSELLLAQGEDTRTILLLPPRFRGHEAKLLAVYNLAGMREVGLRAAWTWLKGMFGFRRKLEPTPA